ncbi:MAG: methylated-DNA--[protein]-cysteine S-methyltransferase [Oscillospiraceae bacterium]|nr:methylated-DNA--[protein]-cysteine S-methyltransferase [Oscillospiraceae bacterium]
MFCARYDSPLGPLLLTCEDEGLTGIWFDRECTEVESWHPILEKTKQWLDAYFAGTVPDTDIPVVFHGTPFQKQVWQILRTIPYGEIRTYGSIAREMADILGKEKMSAQAVGQAVGRNPISILVPCHRVVGSGGKLTGYASGLDKKVWLLQHEGYEP